MSRCAAFHTLITQVRIWKGFLVENSTSLLHLPIPLSAETWKIFTNMLCQFFMLKLTFYGRKHHILENIFFAKQELITHVRLQLYKTSWLVRISLSMSAITKSFAFFLGNLIYKSNGEVRWEYPTCRGKIWIVYIFKARSPDLFVSIVYSNARLLVNARFTL